MDIEWNTLAIIASPIIALFVGIWVNRKFESRPILISYFGHISSFRITPPDRNPVSVHTHSVVLRNIGRRAATNVRLHHKVLPDFSISPSIDYRTETLPDGTQDIIVPTMVPGEELTVSYLYFPPLTALDVNAGIKCDQGFAQAIPVLLQRQYPKWIIRIITALFFIGIVSVLYLIYFGIAVILKYL
jgi:hypothetical protein